MLQVFLLILNLALVLAFSVFAISQFRLRSPAAYLLGLFIAAYADIVLVLQAAGVFNALRQPVVLALQVVLTACAGILWVRAGRPQLLGPLSRLNLAVPSRDLSSLIRLALLLSLGGVVAYVYLRHAEVVMAVVPGNYDALTYHLARVGYWLQYHSFYPWPTPNPRQTTFPMNAELGLLWTILWWGSDRLAGFVQWVSVPATMLGIYGMARLLRCSRWQSAMTALLWGTLTQVLMQSSTTQNDLVTTAFWVAATYFFFYGVRERSRGMAALSGAAFGLALGAKSTSLLVLPGAGLAAIIAAVLYRKRREFWLGVRGWAVALLAGALLFGSYIYIQNLMAFGNPFGASTVRTGPTMLHAEAGVMAYGERLTENAARYIYQYTELTGLPSQLALRLRSVKDAAYLRAFDWLGIDVENPSTIALESFRIPYINPLNENSSWFGPLAIFLVPVVFLQAYRGARQRQALPVFMLLVGLGFFLAQSALQFWTPYKGRYFVIPVALVFPLMAGVLSVRTAWRAVLTVGLVVLGMTSMLIVTLNDQVLRQTGLRDVLSGQRRYPSTWFNEFDYRMLINNVPADAAIGTTGGLDFRDYPLFGTRFTHRVTLAIPDDPSLVPAGDTRRYAMDFQNSAYLFLVGTSWPDSATAILGEFEPMSEHVDGSLWIRKGLRPADECDSDKWPFRDFYRSSAGVPVCARFPIAVLRPALGRDLRFTPSIANSQSNRLRFDLLVKKSTPAQFSVRFAPHEDAAGRIVRLTLTQAGSDPEVNMAPIDAQGVLRFETTLHGGLYTVELILLGAPGQLRVPRFEIALP